MRTLAFLIDEMQSAKKLIRYAALLGKDLNAKVHVWYVQYPHLHGTNGFDTHAHMPVTWEQEACLTLPICMK